MSESDVPEKVKVRIWGKAAGRCEYEGCNRALWRDDLTQDEFTNGYVGHIVSDSPDGPRGDPVRSPELAAAFVNLMLLCGDHHPLIDKKEYVPTHPEARLLAMKAAHERRVEISCAVTEDRQSHVLLYGPNIGDHRSPLSYSLAAAALLGERNPAESRPITLEARDSSLRDGDPEFWRVEERGLVEKFEARVRPRLADGSMRHVSVFALAPQPLLVRLGTLLTDIVPASIFQLHREPQGWRWPADAPFEEFRVERPSSAKGTPALVLSLSATITSDRIESVLRKPVSLWQVTIDQPRQDFVRSRDHLRRWREVARSLMDEIKAVHGQDAVLHVFPAVPVSIAVELGRIRQPKADLKWRIYDEIRAQGGFRPCMDVG